MLTQRMQLMQSLVFVFMRLALMAPAGQYLKQIPQPMHSLAGAGYRGRDFTGLLA